jgi:hypothetical protein
VCGAALAACQAENIEVAKEAETAPEPVAASAAALADTCAFTNGITYNGFKRFMFGENYSVSGYDQANFAADFGGIAAWSMQGVSGSTTAANVRTDFQAMKDKGVNVIRWFMLPEFKGDGITWHDNGTPTNYDDDYPTGLGGTMVADIQKALEIAAEKDVYLMFALFSFDNFHPTHDASGIKVRNLKPMITDATKRAAVIEKVVRPIAQTIRNSPYSGRAISIDLINEPEWAMTGSSLYGGDPAFEPNAALDPVTHTQMETFVKDMAAVFDEETNALLTVGGTAMKWKNAWTGVSQLDFYSLHMYDWINQWWPYNNTASSYGFGTSPLNKPLVMSEFPNQGLTQAPAANVNTILDSWYANGYAGGLAWSYTDIDFPWSSASAHLLDFQDDHPCEVTYPADAMLSNQLYYAIKPKHVSGLTQCMDVSSWSQADAGNVAQYTCNAVNGNQQWFLEDAGSGYKKLRAMHSNKCLRAAATTDGGNVDQYVCGAGYEQQWSVESTGNGYYKLVNRSANKCLTVYNSGTGNSVNYEVRTCATGDNQKFLFAPSVGTKVRIKNLNSNKYFKVASDSTVEASQASASLTNRETFERFSLGGTPTQYAYRGYNRKFLKANGNSPYNVNVNSFLVDPWVRWTPTVISGSTVSLKANANNLFLSTDTTAPHKVWASAASVTGTQHHYVVETL